MKIRNFSLKLALVSVVGLSACNSSSSSTSPCNEKPPSGRVAAADLMLDCINTLNPTSLSSMPTGGTAVYNGFATGTIDTSASTSDVLYADAQLTANFNPGSLSVNGSLTNFSSGDVGSMTGSANITGGSIVGTGYTGATVSSAGALGYGADSVTLSGTSDGAFFGNGAKAVLGVISGTNVMTGSGYTGTMSMGVFGLK